LPSWGGTGYTPGAGGGATLAASGAGGVPAIPPNYAFGQQPGGGGIGPASFPDPLNAAYTSAYLGAGGNAVKGTCCYYYGYAGGGGGGWFGGGAGGTIDAELVGGGAGGGSGFIAANAVDTLAETGVRSGDGRVVLRYSVVPLALAVARNGSGSGTVTSSPGGVNCGATCTANFSPGTSVTLTAAATAGSVFTGWLGPCSGLGDCNVAMNAAKTVSATIATGIVMPVPDADGDAAYDALTDGLLVSRYLAGSRAMRSSAVCWG
jgi:hypothetical protein